MCFLESDVFLRKKSPRQGCTKPKTELGMHQNPHFNTNQLKINKNPKINPPSTITIPESGKCNVPIAVTLWVECVAKYVAQACTNTSANRYKQTTTRMRINVG